MALPHLRFRKTVAFLITTLATALLASASNLGPGLLNKLNSTPAGSTLQVVVTFRGASVSPAQISAVRTLGISRGIVFDQLPIMGVLATPAQVQSLIARSDVRSVWLNSKLRYYNYEARNLTGAERLRTDAAMTKRNGGLPYSGKGVTVMINDSGTDGTHADTAYGTHVIQNVLGSTNLNAESDLLPVTYTENVPNTDTAGHGSHVTGIVGGNGAHSGGKYAGVAPGASLVGYGSGAAIAVLDSIGGLNYALSHQAQYGIRAINNSWGPLDVTPFDPDDPVNVASKALYDHNIVVVFAAGNDGPGIATLNAYCAPWTVCVANAHKLDGTLDNSSSRGQAGGNRTFTVDGDTWTYENRPTVSAPGTDIISVRATLNNNSYASSNGPTDDVAMIEPANLPYYVVLSGTSMAAPHILGVVALMLEANPSLSASEVKSILQQTATNMSGYESWEDGAGMVNAYAAVDRSYRAANYGTTLNMNKTYKSSVKLNSSDLPVAVSYNTVPAASPTQNQFPFDVPNGVTQLRATVNVYGIAQQTGNTVNLVLIAPDGTETSSGVSLLFAITYDRTVVLDLPTPGHWTLELRGLRGDPTNPTDGAAVPEDVTGSISLETASAVSGLNDISGHPAAASIMVAVSQHLVDGYSDKTFKPDQALTRGAMAPYLLSGMELRQYLPVTGAASFSDVSGSLVPFAEAVSAKGAALRDVFQKTRGVMLPTSTGKFSPNSNVTRLDLAYTFVQALGLEQTALSLNGQPLTVQYGTQRVPIDDAASIPAALSGYVQQALDYNIMQAYFTLTQGPYDLQPTVHATFKPTKTITRADYAVHAVRFFSAFLHK